VGPSRISSSVYLLSSCVPVREHGHWHAGPVLLFHKMRVLFDAPPERSPLVLALVSRAPGRPTCFVQCLGSPGVFFGVELDRIPAPERCALIAPTVLFPRCFERYSRSLIRPLAPVLMTGAGIKLPIGGLPPPLRRLQRDGGFLPPLGIEKFLSV